MKRIKYRVSFDLYTKDDPKDTITTYFLGWLLKYKINLMNRVTSVSDFKIFRIVHQ